jgi:hypothetical protein
MAPDQRHPGVPAAEPADDTIDAPPDHEELLGAAANDLEAKTEASDRARMLRDERIWQAVNDGGYSWSKVAGWARVSRSHVGDVLGNAKVRDRVLGVVE